MPLVLGALHVDPPVVLAPMAGITDPPFRLACAEQGGGLFVSEMITARGLVEGNHKSWAMTRPHPDETPRSVQLYGADPATVGAAVTRLVTERDVDHVDLNVGCPVAKVMRHGGGAALPVKRRLFAAVVRAAVDAAGTTPVTVKMRLGLDEDRLTFLDAGRIAADQGVAAVALHARTAAQGYAGTARWSAIATLRERLDPSVAVLGNGDIWAADDALRMMAETGCDGVVVGRGCLGRPWLFGDLARVFRGRPALGPPPLSTTKTLARGHLARALAWREDERDALRRFRKHLRWYLQGYPVGPRAHRAAGQVTTAHEVEALFAGLDDELEVVPESVRAPRGRTGGVGRLVIPQGWWEQRDASVTVAEPAGALDGG